MNKDTQPRKVFKPRWADIATCIFVCGAVVAFVAAVFERIPA